MPLTCHALFQIAYTYDAHPFVQTHKLLIAVNLSHSKLSQIYTRLVIPGFTVATVDLDGSIGSFALDPSNHSGVPLVVHAFLEEDATLRY